MLEAEKKEYCVRKHESKQAFFLSFDSIEFSILMKEPLHITILVMATKAMANGFQISVYNFVCSLSV